MKQKGGKFMKSIHPLAKKHLEKVSPYIPGKPIEEVARELGLSPEKIIKLASNENLLGPSYKALKILRKKIKEVNFYPDDNCFYLRKKIAEIHNVSMDEIIVGNGSVEIIYLLGFAFLGEGDSVAYCKGSFPIYEIIADVTGAEKISPPLKKENKAVDPIALLNSIKPNTKIVFMSNPNNPTGTYFTHEEAKYIVENSPKNVLLVFDEAYSEFVDAPDFPNVFSFYRDYPNVCIMRTFSKTVGLAGLRVGYMIARKEIIETLHKVRYPFNVNLLAQYAAIYALEDKEFMEKTYKLIKKEREFLYKEFEKLGLLFLPSQTNFIYVEFPKDANFVYNELLKRGIITRPIGPLFPNALRITIGKRKHNLYLIKSLKEILKG
jgi:histidinol-phosphate aminotransferase